MPVTKCSCGVTKFSTGTTANHNTFRMCEFKTLDCNVIFLHKLPPVTECSRDVILTLFGMQNCLFYYW